MGFIQPDLPAVDHEVWSKLPREQRTEPMARHFAEHGFGSPDVVILVYVVKMIAYAAIAWAFILSTPGIDGFFAVDQWWRSGVVIYKIALWTMLFEVLGLGCGFGPLNLRFIPPMGSFLYWLRPGTIRLAPFGGRVPGTGGDTRSVVDVVLYAAFAGSIVVAMWGALGRAEVLVVLVLFALLSLRDQVIFLAARGEVYGAFLITFLFASADQLTGAKAVLLMIWWGAAFSKLNLHFPSVMAAMQSNNPFLRFGGIRRRFHRDFPDDLRPSRVAGVIAHSATVVEFCVPAVLFFSHGGWPTIACGVIMITFHLGIISSFPMGVPLEWNVFMIFGVIFVFLAHPGIAWGALAYPVTIAALFGVLLAFVVYGNAVPSKVSFLVAMRYYAGNWATTVWCFRGDALDRLDAGIVKATMLPHRQLEKIYGSAEEAMIPIHMGYAFRGFHSHGPALYTLVHEACGEGHEDYLVLDGELIAAVALGWNFGDGHLHGEQLIEALQRRCDFRPGDVRVVMLESEPFARGTQAYRLADAATGQFASGHVKVRDLLECQPTSTDVPLYRD
ncbi:MAG: DUF3556 domain-containing protein [Actinobacteria bacterium]|nr:DUF3556 domain-containing protein [Actinomycetota bacterium]